MVKKYFLFDAQILMNILKCGRKLFHSTTPLVCAVYMKCWDFIIFDGHLDANSRRGIDILFYQSLMNVCGKNRMTFEIVEDCIEKKIDGLFWDWKTKKAKNKITYNMRNFMHVRFEHIFIRDEYFIYIFYKYCMITSIV